MIKRVVVSFVLSLFLCLTPAQAAVTFAAASSEWVNSSTTPVTDEAFTMACWFKVTDVDTAYGIISLNDASDAGQQHLLWARGDVASDPLYASSRDTGAFTDSTVNGITAGTWHHAAGVWTSDTSRTVYLNGTAGTTDTTSRTVTGTDRIGIGAAGDSTPSAYLDGETAECGVWSVALSGPEISSLSNGFSPLLVNPSNLEFYLPMWSASHLTDEVGGLTLSVNGTPIDAIHVDTLYGHISSVFLGVPSVSSGGTAIIIQLHH